MMLFNTSLIALVLFVVIAVAIAQTIKIIPQQHAWVVERLGRYHKTLTPGPSLVVPFIDRIAHRHVLKEIPLDVPSQVCITRDKTLEERELINHSIVNALDEAAANWGVKVLRYEIKDLTPPKEILHAMQAQITAEREKRALIAASEGKKQEQINLASGAREAAIQKSEGEKQAAINQAQGQAAATLAVAEANACAIQQIAAAIQSAGGSDAVNLKIA